MTMHAGFWRSISLLPAGGRMDVELDQERGKDVLAGWQLVPLAVGLKRSITGGEKYNRRVIKAIERLGARLRGFTPPSCNNPFLRLLWEVFFWLSKVAGSSRRTLFFFDSSCYLSLFFVLLYIRIFKQARIITTVYHLTNILPKNPVRRMVYRFFEGRAIRLSHLILTISNSTREDIRKIAGGFVSPFIVPPGMEIVALKRRRSYKTKPPFRIISLGFIAPQKGVETLIKAVGLLDHLDVEVDWVGDYSQERWDYYLRCKELVAKLGLQDKFRFRGYLNREELSTLLEEADLFVSPSSLEGYGIVIIEAASFSLPLLLSDIAPFREFAGDDALYFKPGDCEGLAEVIERLLQDHKKRERMGRAVYERVDFAYDWDSMQSMVQEVVGEWWRR